MKPNSFSTTQNSRGITTPVRALGWSFALVLGMATLPVTAAEKLNVVFILADDKN